MGSCSTYDFLCTRKGGAASGRGPALRSRASSKVGASHPVSLRAQVSQQQYKQCKPLATRGPNSNPVGSGSARPDQVTSSRAPRHQN